MPSYKSSGWECEGTFKTDGPITIPVNSTPMHGGFRQPCVQSPSSVVVDLVYSVKELDPTNIPLSHTPPDDTFSYKLPEHDPTSFKKVVESGNIRMTHYRVGRFAVRHHVAQVPSGPWRNDGNWSSSSWGTWTYQDGFIATNVAACPEGGTQPVRGAIDFFNRIRPVSRFSFTKEGTVIGELDGDLASSLERVKVNAVANLNKKVDAATDYRERQASLSTIRSALRAAVNPLRSARQLVTNLNVTDPGAVKALASDWLAFRYGIMPIVYSVQDAVSLLKAQDSEYHTGRARKTLHYVADLSQIPQENTVFTVLEGKVIVNATAKVRLHKANLSKLHGTSFNYINAIWETIPYSLVVDWFVNVGDYLTAATSANPVLEKERQYCYSIKKELWRRTYARRLVDGVYKDFLVREVEEVTYDRIPFTNSDLRVSFSPQLNSWKRWVDAFALSLNPLNKALRRLR